MVQSGWIHGEKQVNFEGDGRDEKVKLFDMFGFVGFSDQ